LSLHAEVSTGLVVTPVESHELYLHAWADGRRESLTSGSDVLAQHVDVLAVEVGFKELLIFDVRDRTSRPVTRPPQSRWGMFGSFSPDGTLFAIDVSLEERAVDVGAEYVRQPTRLAIVDVATGRVQLTDEDFDNFATTPVWSPDSRWAIFSAPFEDALWLCDTTATPRLDRLDLNERAPSPLADVTDLVG
jgi:hypothetical protein